MADAEDPYVIYQLRKPHQRGTAVVPRLVPKSHAPAFSHVRNRFARVCPAPDDEQLYLPKSLEYPANWNSFGSESSIWSASSAASAFPNRLQPLTASSATSPLAPANPSRRILRSKAGSAVGSAADSADGDDASSARSITSLTERTSLLSSDGTRSLKSFIRFDAPLTSGLQAPVAVRPVKFLLPPPLSQVEREDSIVQAAIDDPSSVAPTDDEDFISPHSKPSKDSPAPEREAPTDQASRSRRRLSLRSRRPAHSPSTRQRRSMWAWLFGGGEKPLGGRRYADAHVAPIMDEDEEELRRAQFVRSSRQDSGRQSRSFSKRFSWRKRSTSVDSRRNSAALDRDGVPIGGGRRSARQIWRSIRRSASFTLGSKKHGDAKESFHPTEEGGIGDLSYLRADITAEDGSGPSDSFVKRKMASLRENTSRRMAAVVGEIEGANDSFSRTGRNTDTPLIPTERREDRPRATRSTPSASSRPSQSGSRVSAGVRVYNSKASTISLSELISARPELQHATSESVEMLANRINSDLSHGTTLPSVSDRSGSGSSSRSTPVRDNSFGLFGVGNEKGNVLQTSAVSSEGNSEGLLPGVQNIICEKAPSPILRPMQPYQHPRPRAPQRGKSNVASELQLSSASKMSIQMLKARTGAVSSSSSTPKTSMRSMLQDKASEKTRKESSNTGSDYSHPHATQLDVFCQCNCSCVYESDCQQACEDSNGSGKAAFYSASSLDFETKSRNKTPKQREINDESPGAESPSLSLINGSRAETPHKLSAEEWMETIRRRLENFPSSGSAGLSGVTYRAVDELSSVPRKPGFAQPAGRYEEMGNSDWAARYGKPSRAMPGATISHQPDTRGLSYHPRERHASSASSAARELSPLPAASVEYRGGVRIERRRGEPPRTRRAPSQPSGDNKTSMRAEPGTPQLRSPPQREPQVRAPQPRASPASTGTSKSPLIIKYPVANGRASEGAFRVLSPAMHPVSHDGAAKQTPTDTHTSPVSSVDPRGASARSKPRKPRVRTSGPTPSPGGEANTLSPSAQWLIDSRTARQSRHAPPADITRPAAGSAQPTRVRLVEEHARGSSRKTAPRVDALTRTPEGNIRRHANMQPRHGRSALREVHRDEVRSSRPRAATVKPEEADLRRSGGRSLMGRFLGM